MPRDAKNRIEPEKYRQRDHEKKENYGYRPANVSPELIIKLSHLLEFNIPPQEWRNEHEGKKHRKRTAQDIRTCVRWYKRKIRYRRKSYEANWIAYTGGKTMSFHAKLDANQPECAAISQQ